MDKKQIANLLGAGTLTGLVLASVLLFGQGQLDASAAADNTAASQPAIVEVAAPSTDGDPLQVQNDQLQEALQTMQEREAAYQEQIELANEALAEQAANSAPAYSEEYEEDEHEEGEYEEEEHEEGEYEEVEHEEEEHEEGEYEEVESEEGEYEEVESEEEDDDEYEEEGDD